MRASNVEHAAVINLAHDKFGVDPALLQSIIDVANDPDNITALPVGAHQYASSYASNRSLLDQQGRTGYFIPEANVMAASWWLVRLYQTYNNQWDAVKAYFEMSPVGEAKMRRIYFDLYPKRAKQWRNS